MQQPGNKENKRQEKIKAIAHRLYVNRRGLQQVHNPQQALKDWMRAERIAKNPLRQSLFFLNQPLITSERFLESLLSWLKQAALLEILGLLGNLGLIIAVLLYFGTEKQRRDIEVYTAWQTITSAYGQPGNGGRIRALEFLNASPGASWRRRTFPFCRRSIICWFWPSESLQGLDVSGATLRHINLEGATLVGANLEGANLGYANLEEAILLERV
ncbi:MAG: pentapeptide repeat-containing protein [Cyanobacteria bacterium J06638_20]